jgi:glycosyltransferase involved in cell wall biosynthesis
MVNNSLSVLIIQRILPEYRIKFFSELSQFLQKYDISLRVIYGQEYPGTVPKTQKTDEPWSCFAENRYFNLHGTRLVWQPVLKDIINADLIIVEQSNSLIINYFVLFLRFLGVKKVAFWGHGRNMQSGNKSSFSENLKRILIGSVDWWFAYTGNSVEWVANTGFPVSKITNVQNAIDTSSFKLAIEQVTAEQLTNIKNHLGIISDEVLLYCGGMYADKKLNFLIDACHQLKAIRPELHIVFIGNGPQQYLVENEAKNSHWLHYVGPIFGSERAAYFKLSKALLMPGLVGLSIVDSFVASTPLFTTNIPIHSPEIDYLENNVNGVMTEPNVSDYVNALNKFLSNTTLQEKLCAGCIASAEKYTLSNMVVNFASGIIECLKGRSRVN